MPARILCIQFRRNSSTIAHEQRAITRELGGSATPRFVGALNATLPWEAPASLLSGYDGVILGGSSEFDLDGGRREDDEAKRTSYVLLERLRPLLAHVFENELPTLGICYGHQLVGAFAGVRVVADPAQGKVRSHEVRLMPVAREHRLFSGLPERFFAHYGHKDVLESVPDGATLLAHGGAECRVSALSYGRAIYTTQFHPELTHADMAERLAGSTDYLPDGVLADTLFFPAPHSNRILRTFGALVAEEHPQANGSTSVPRFG